MSPTVSRTCRACVRYKTHLTPVLWPETPVSPSNLEDREDQAIIQRRATKTQVRSLHGQTVSTVPTDPALTRDITPLTLPRCRLRGLLYRTARMGMAVSPGTEALLPSQASPPPILLKLCPDDPGSESSTPGLHPGLTPRSSAFLRR